MMNPIFLNLIICVGVALFIVGVSFSPIFFETVREWWSERKVRKQGEIAEKEAEKQTQQIYVFPSEYVPKGTSMLVPGTPIELGGFPKKKKTKAKTVTKKIAKKKPAKKKAGKKK